MPLGGSYSMNDLLDQVRCPHPPKCIFLQGPCQQWQIPIYVYWGLTRFHLAISLPCMRWWPYDTKVTLWLSQGVLAKFYCAFCHLCSSTLACSYPFSHSGSECTAYTCISHKHQNACLTGFTWQMVYVSTNPVVVRTGHRDRLQTCWLVVLKAASTF